MVSDGVRAVIFGRLRSDDAPVWWSGDWASWQRRPLPPEAFGGIPRAAAAGPAGFVVVGYDYSSAGSSPVIWHLDGEAGIWAPEPAPVVEAAREPTSAECGDVPDDVLELMTTDSSLFAHCFASEEITIRAWSMRCDGCSYDGPGSYEPEWLAQPVDNLLHLSPIDSDQWGWTDAILSPSVRKRAAWEGELLEVTGHYADPAADTCRWQPAPIDEVWYSGRRDFIEGCRSRFVVSAVRAVRRP